ncbi:MAG: hypothetical protein IT284_02765 [Bacteroidetes bacterium]|nr:hypothetical protein [Bacteroidota bacterium]
MKKTILYVFLTLSLVIVLFLVKPGAERLLVKYNILENESAVIRAQNHFRTNRNVPKQSFLSNYKNKIKQSYQAYQEVVVVPAEEPVEEPISSSTPPTEQIENIDQVQVVVDDSSVPSIPQSENETSPEFMWGVFNGWQPQNITDFENLVEEDVDMAGVFVHWGNENEFPFTFANPLKNEGKTTVIYWEAKDYNLNTDEQSAFSYDAILEGNWDSYITEFAKDAKDFGGKVILIPFEEANGNWEPWSGVNNGNTPEKHRLAYRYIHTFFSDVPNVKFGWTMNNDSVPNTTDNQFADYYPGNVYIDYIGIDGFNFGSPWQTWDEVFSPAIDELSSYGKPIILTSVASAQGTSKASWIRTGLGQGIKNYPSVVGWIWFNENKEKDWRVNSDSASLSAFKEVVSE